MGRIGKPQYGRLSLLLCSTVFLAPGVALAQSGDTTLESVVVTAQKREENLQTVPVAVTAVTRQTLAETRFVNLRDLDAVAPGVTVREGAGGIQNAQFSIRGVYATGTFGSDAGVAFYADGVYIASTLGTEFDLADVERIEVLRGPQGTLFGRNAVAGAINVITKEPTGEFAGHLQFAGGNMGQRRAKANIDLPAMGIVSVSFSALYDKKHGDVKNLGAGTVWHWGAATDGKYGDLVSPKRLGGHETKAMSVAVKIDFTDDIKTVYRFNYSHKDFVPDAVGVTALPLPESGLTFAAWSAQPAALRTPISNTRPDALNNWYHTPGVGKVESHSLTTTATIMDGVTLKDVFGYRKTGVWSTNQLSGLGGLFTSNLPIPLPYPPGTPLLVVENATENEQETVSNEFQVNIDIDRIKSTFGHLYYRSTGDEGPLGNAVNTTVLSGLASPAWFGFNVPVIRTPFRPIHNRITTESQAVYGHTEFRLTDQLSVVGGIRYTKDKRSGLDGSSTTASPQRPATLVSYKKGTWTYLVGANYQVTDDIFSYVHYSTGYISGGQIANLQFDPQTAKSWEAGIKADLLDQRLRVNAALFTVKYGQVQTLTAALTPGAGCSDKPGVTPGASQCIINGGDARARGLELEVTAIPMRGVTLTGNAAYTDMQYTRVDPLLRAPADGGFVVQYIPKYTANFSAIYRGPDAIVGDAHLNARLDANYSSATWSGSNARAAITQLGRIPARWVFNGRAGLAGFKVGGAEVEVAAYGKNLLNNKRKAYSAFLGLSLSATYLEARTYGVELNASF
jgi:iron complex outermembrane receptor protein